MTDDPVLLAWAAGFFEGEGCISNHAGTARSLLLTVVNTDLERLQHFADIAGCGRIYERKRQTGKRIWQWNCYSDNAVRVFRAMEPWLGERRRKRFAEILAIREARIAEATAPRPCEWCGGEFRPRFHTNSRHQKYCGSVCSSRAAMLRHGRVVDVESFLAKRKNSQVHIPANLSPCSVDGCEIPQRAKGLCKPHYARALAGKPIDTPIKQRGPYRRRSDVNDLIERSTRAAA